MAEYQKTKEKSQKQPERKGMTIRLMIDFSTLTWEAKSQWNITLNVLTEMVST